MKIKLIKDATIHGIKSKTGRVHEVIDRVAQKLIDRGYAELHKSELKAEQKPEPEPEVEADKDGTTA